MAFNTSFENSINAMKIENPKDYSELDWGCISQYKYLSEEFIENHLDRLSMKCISNHQKLREEFIEKHIDKLDLTIILRQKGIKGLSKAFMQKHCKNIPTQAKNKRKSVTKLPKQWRSNSEPSLVPEKPVKTFERFFPENKPLQRVKTYSNLPLEIPLKPMPTPIVQTFDYQSPNQYNYLTDNINTSYIKEDYQNSVKIENQYDFLSYDYSLVGKKILDTYCSEDYFKSRFF